MERESTNHVTRRIARAGRMSCGRHMKPPQRQHQNALKHLKNKSLAPNVKGVSLPAVRRLQHTGQRLEMLPGPQDCHHHDLSDTLEERSLRAWP